MRLRRPAKPEKEPGTLHITNGDAAIAAVAQAAGIKYAQVVPWRDVLHDGPVPEDMEPEELAELRVAHLSRRGWAHAADALEQFRFRDERLDLHPPENEIVLWFEDDLYDALQLAQIDDRIVGRPGPVRRVHLSHGEGANIAEAYAGITDHVPDPKPWAAFTCPDPREWELFGQFARLCEELPEVRSGLSRLEREILEALEPGPLGGNELFEAVSVHEQPPWIGDWPMWAIAEELEPLLDRNVKRKSTTYTLNDAGRRVLSGQGRREVPDRWIGGVRLGPDRVNWMWDAADGRVTSGAPEPELA